MDRYVCIHGHFYQPPRENPWLEAIELQDSAYPYHDWNERITAECYAPNAFSRVLSGDGRIEKIVNNYARISFNFGPTLLSWMEEKIPRGVPRRPGRRRGKPQGVLRTRLRPGAGVQPHHPAPGQRRGQGNAGALGDRGLHVPLRAASGGHLAPGDRRGPGNPRGPGPGGDPVHDPRPAPGRPGAGEGGRRLERRQRRPDRSHDPVRARLPSGRKISLFFYDGPISQAVAFERLLDNGEFLANRLLGAFSDQRPWPQQLVHIATDGETYGHHHAHGEMALTHAMRLFDANPEVRDHQLRRVPGEIPAHPRSADHREQFLELRPRRGALAKQLRMQLRRPPGVEPGVAGTAAGGAGLAPGHRRPPVRGGREEGLQGPVGRPGTSTSR